MSALRGRVGSRYVPLGETWDWILHEFPVPIGDPSQTGAPDTLPQLASGVSKVACLSENTVS